MKFKMVEELAHEQQDVAHACLILKVSRSGYSEWLGRPPSVRKTEDERLWPKIKQHWEASRKTYGRLRIAEKLKAEGEQIGKNRVSKIMRNNNIQGIGKKKFKPVTTTSDHKLPVAERIFETENAPQQVTRPNQYWGGDITYVPTGEGWLYLAVFLDLFSRKAVGHSMRETMHAEMVISAIDMALKRQGLTNSEDLVTHSDRGSQYASSEYREKLAAHKITASMSRKGNCYDNAFVESFFRTLKVELIYTRKFKTREEARAAIFEFIEVWYNRQRLHSSLDYMTPEQYEAKQLSAA
jgi:transposase InsO family protein